MRDVQCGKVVIRDGLALAPMAGVTDRSFRQVCRRFERHTRSAKWYPQRHCARSRQSGIRIRPASYPASWHRSCRTKCPWQSSCSDMSRRSWRRRRRGWHPATSAVGRDTSFLPPWISTWAVPSAKLSETGKAAPRCAIRHSPDASCRRLCGRRIRFPSRSSCAPALTSPRSTP